MIDIVDYGRGNLRSVEKALEKLGYDAEIMATPKDIKGKRGIILPGVGAFADSMNALRRGDWIAPLNEYCRGRKAFL